MNEFRTELTALGGRVDQIEGWVATWEDQQFSTTTKLGSNPNEKFGLFDGNHSALAQVTYQPSSTFRIAGTYVNSYDRSNLRHGTGSIASQVQWQNPLNVANRNNPVVGNSYGVEASLTTSLLAQSEPHLLSSQKGLI